MNLSRRKFRFYQMGNHVITIEMLLLIVVGMSIESNAAYIMLPPIGVLLFVMAGLPKSK